MTLARWIERIFVGKDLREEKDREIAEQKALIRNSTQAVQSGARLVQHMSGVMQLMAENNGK